MERAYNSKADLAISGALQLLPPFCYQFSEIAAPPTRLTEKKIAFHWECQVAFDGLKEALCEAPILVGMHVFHIGSIAYPRAPGLFVVDTEASNTEIGGIL